MDPFKCLSSSLRGWRVGNGPCGRSFLPPGISSGCITYSYLVSFLYFVDEKSMPKTIQPPHRVALVYNADKPRAHHEWLRLKRWLEQHKVQVTAASRVTSAMKNSHFVVAVGGDGTVLSVARHVAAWGIPVLGVNVGRLGFLAATEVGAMFRTLSRVLSGESRVEVRTMLSVAGTSRGKKFGPYLALNDCVVRSGATGRVLLLQAAVRNKPLASYAGDGLIIAT